MKDSNVDISTQNVVEISNVETSQAPLEQLKSDNTQTESQSSAGTVEGIAIKIPKKRTVADRTPTQWPTLTKKSLTRSGFAIKGSAPYKLRHKDDKNITLSLKEPLDFSFGQNGPTLLPESNRQVHSTSQNDTEMPDLSCQDGVPSWFLVYQKQQQQQTTVLKQRMNMLEDVVAENKQLRRDLVMAHERIAELEANLPNEEIPTLTLNKKEVPGTEASKYAHNKTLSAVSTSASSPAAPLSFAAVVKKNKPAVPKKKKITAKQVEAIQRRFAPVSAEAGFEYVYLPSRYKEPVSSLRSKLRKLKINTSRVLDIHYPARQVVALLVHAEYKKNLLDAFGKAKVKAIENFDPLNPSHLQDPKFVDLSVSERQAKCEEIRQNRLVRALAHIRDQVRPSVARFFFVKNWITLEQLKQAVPASSRVQKKNNDETMEDVAAAFCTSEEPLDVGESTPSQ